MTPQGRTGGPAGNSRSLRGLGLGDAGGLEAGFAGEREVELVGRRVAPGVGGVAGDGLDIGAGFGGRAPSRRRRPRRGPRRRCRPRRRGRCCRSRGEVGEVAGGGGEGLGRVEGVLEAAQLGRAGHELGDALGAGRADGGGVEEAFLPDQPGEEARVEAVGAGRRSRSGGRHRRCSWPRGCRRRGRTCNARWSRAAAAGLRGRRAGRVSAGSARAGAGEAEKARRQQCKEAPSPGHGRETSGGKEAVPEGWLGKP